MKGFWNEWSVQLTPWLVSHGLRIRKRIKMAFDKEGIEIPLPQRVIHQYTHVEEK